MSTTAHSLPGPTRKRKGLGARPFIPYTGPVTTLDDLYAAIPAPTDGEWAKAHAADAAQREASAANTKDLRRAKAQQQEIGQKLGKAFGASRPKPANLMSEFHEIAEEVRELRDNRAVLDIARGITSSALAAARRTDQAFKAYMLLRAQAEREFRAIERQADDRWPPRDYSGDDSLKSRQWVERQRAALVSDLKDGRFDPDDQ